MPAATREQAFIDVISQTLGSAMGDQAGLSDDAFYDPLTRQVLTTDMLVEGRHFDLAYFTPFDLGWKAAAVNVSDVAAMGATAQYLLVSLALPENTRPDFVQGLYEGLAAFCKQYNTRVVGGDTVASPHVSINVTATGILPPGHAPGFRHAAQAGDVVVTTGWHGLSAMGLWAFQKNLGGFDVARRHHLRPEPRVSEALLLSKTCDRYALIDSSDGLADAVLRLAEESGVDITLDETLLPLHAELRDVPDRLHAVLYGGEDFELVAAIPPEKLTPELARHFSVVGRVASCSGKFPAAHLVDAGGTVKETLSFEKTWQHFHKETT